MRIDEISIPRTKQDAKERLLRHGYELLGTGNFADVFAKKGKPYVLKLFSATDIAYIKFLHLVKSTPNIHFPKIFGKFIKVNDSYWAVRLEQLEPFENSYAFINDTELHKFCVNKPTRHEINWLVMTTIRDFTKECQDNTNARPNVIMSMIERNQPGLINACRAIGKISGGGFYSKNVLVDIHIDNLMFRGNILVITDPLM